MTHYHQIQDAENELESLRSAYLRRFGWESTCNTPGAFWLWRRDFAKEDAEMTARDLERKLPSPHKPYGIITTSTELAISMTVRMLDEQNELAEETAEG